MKFCAYCNEPRDDEPSGKCPNCEQDLIDLPDGDAPALPALAHGRSVARPLTPLRDDLREALADADATADARAEAPVDDGAPADPLKPSAAQVQDRPTGDITPERLEEISESGRFSIGLLGYPGCGKTWFLNRLKHLYEQEQGGNPITRLFRRRRFLPDPPSVDDAEKVDRTDWIEAHDFTCFDSSAKQGETDRVKARSFYIIDIPGERFLDSVKARFRGDNARSLVEALNVCDALVIMLPAEPLLVPADVLAASTQCAEPPKPVRELSAELSQLKTEAARRPRRKGAQVKARREELNAQIEQMEDLLDEARAFELGKAREELGAFVRSLAWFSVTTRILRRNRRLGRQMSVDEVLALSPADRSKEIESLNRGDTPPPVYVALSKSDHVDHEFAEFLNRHARVLKRERFDADPTHSVRKAPVNIERAIADAFSTSRFDFLTSFDGHDGSLTIKYGLPSYGVHAVIDWIEWARRRERTRWWLRWDTAFASILKWVRDLVAPTPLPTVEAVEAQRSDTGRLLGWPGRGLTWLIDSFILWRWGGLVWTGVGVALVTLLGAYLLGLTPTRVDTSGPAPAITPLAVYPTEIDRMAKAAPLLDQGVVAARVSPWRDAPSDGLLFSLNMSSPARAPLNQAMRLTRLAQSQQPLSPDAADRIIDRFNKADDALENINHDAPGRSVIDYHQGLLLLWSGRPGQAQSHFKAVIERLKGLSQDGLASISLARERAVLAATEYASGVALLSAARPDPWATASVLSDASDGVGLLNIDDEAGKDARRELAPLAERDIDFYDFDPRVIAQLHTSDLAADLIAAEIRVQSNRSASAEQKAAAATILQDAVALWSKDEAVQSEPELCVNLLAASMRLGDKDGVAVFEPCVNAEAAADSKESVSQLLQMAQAVYTPSDGGVSAIAWPDRAWVYTRNWRPLFINHDVAGLVRAQEAVEASDAPSDDKAFLRGWDSQVVHTAAMAAQGTARRAIARAYAPLLVGADTDILHDARAPFGTLVGYFLLVPVVLIAALVLFAYWHLRETYWRLFGARHRADRLRASRK